MARTLEEYPRIIRRRDFLPFLRNRVFNNVNELTRFPSKGSFPVGTDLVPGEDISIEWIEIPDGEGERIRSGNAATKETTFETFQRPVTVDHESPDNPYVGQLWLDLRNNIVSRWNGMSWVPAVLRRWNGTFSEYLTPTIDTVMSVGNLSVNPGEVGTNSVATYSSGDLSRRTIRTGSALAGMLFYSFDSGRDYQYTIQLQRNNVAIPGADVINGDTLTDPKALWWTDNPSGRGFDILVPTSWLRIMEERFTSAAASFQLVWSNNNLAQQILVSNSSVRLVYV